MANMLLSVGGLISVGIVSSQQSSANQRTVQRVEMATRGPNPSGDDIVVALQLDGVTQAGTYVLPAGLKYAVNTSTLIVPASVAINFIVVAASASPQPTDLDVTLNMYEGPASIVLDTTDCGLGTLGELKRFCITASMAGDNMYNEAMLHIGRSTAKAFDDAVGRHFKREVGALEQFNFSRRYLMLAHAPIESITKMELKYTEAEGWIDLTTGIPLCMIDFVEGILTVPDDFWPISAQFNHNRPGLWRLTVTGGYWYDPTDDGSGTPPTGANVLPEDLKTAWLLQCQHLWVNRDNLGITWSPSGESRDTRKSLASVKFIPAVSMALTEYARPVNFR